MFKNWPDKRFIACIFHISRAAAHISSEEAQHVVCFRADFLCLTIPAEIFVENNPKMLFVGNFC